MQHLNKKITWNLIIVTLTYVVPLLHRYLIGSQYRSRELEIIVFLVTFGVILLGSILLICLNSTYINKVPKLKETWSLFVVIGAAGLLYSGSMLYIIYLLYKWT